ncbi:MAG: peptidase associated/transthyretin-like domain-containing protein [Sulfuricaulis sp.]
MMLRKNGYRSLAVLCFFMTLSACADYPLTLTYSADPISATVVDAETKQPLEGVVVTANWELEYGTYGGNVPAGELMVLEAVTDKNGKFHFPAWGPKLAVRSHLVNKDPQLILFKSGYEYRGLVNAFTGDYNKGSQRHSDWNGKTIELKPFKGTEEEYARHLEFLGTSLDPIIDKDCNWKKIPRMVLAINQQSEIFRSKNIYALPSIESLDIRYSNFRARCGSPKEFFKDYQP